MGSLEEQKPIEEKPEEQPQEPQPVAPAVPVDLEVNIGDDVQQQDVMG